MTTPASPPADAAQALTEINHRRAQVVTGALMPDWSFPTIGVLTAALFAAVDTGRAVLVAVAAVGGPALMRYPRRMMHNRPIGDAR